MPAVGPYSRPLTEIGMEVGRGKHPSISSSTSGAPWPRFAHSWGSSRKRCPAACSVHLISPSELRLRARRSNEWILLTKSHLCLRDSYQDQHVACEKDENEG